MPTKQFNMKPNQKIEDPVNFWQWVEQHKNRLRPPVGNAIMFGHNGEFKVMVVAGPNIRKDFHIESHEEYFHQIKGDMVLRIVDPNFPDHTVFRDIPIHEGEHFVLPAGIPHSPQRPADTLGIVLEVERKPEDPQDGLRWYCEQCKAVVYEEWFHCVDLGTQLKPVIERYFGSEELRTCKKCGHVNTK
jgi:3-hydroxyanthranilate 3,4-dioxygenase